MGVRYLDLRYGKKDDRVVDKHGVIEGADFFHNFREIWRFLDENEKEVIIVKL